MNNKKYIMIGAPIITKEIFRNILIPLNNFSFKPSGGFWSCIQINNIGTISDWLTYLQDADGIAMRKNINQGTIFTLKNTVKILTINTPEQILQLAEKYPLYHQILGYYTEINEKNTIFDFQKLSKDYDGVYINIDSFANQEKTIVFQKICVNSLLLFNLDCIKEYQTAYITHDMYHGYYLPYIKSDNISPVQQIEEESYEHKLLTIISDELLLEQESKYDNYSFQDYDEYLVTLTQNANVIMQIIENQEIKKVAEIERRLESKGMQVKRKQIIYNIVLNSLANFLLQNEEKIKMLPKSRTREKKWYIID